MEQGWLHNVTPGKHPLSEDTISLAVAPGESPFNKLREGLIFTSWFILTYNFVILGFILVFTILYWTGKAIRWRQQRTSRLKALRADDAYDGDADIIKESLRVTREVQQDSSSSSRSSTVHNPGSAAQYDADERSCLLRHEMLRRRTIMSSTKAFLMYQPSPIPIFNKTLPSNGTTIVIFAFISLNIFYTFYRINFKILEIAVLADRSGLIFVANLPLLYLLSAKNQPLKVYTGFSYESLNIIHRRLGELMCLEAVIHAFTMVMTWYTILLPRGFTLTRFLLEHVILYGIGAFVCYEVLYLTSLASFRQRWYELFLSLHVTLQTAGLVFVYLHHRALKARIYVLIALTIFLVDRLLYRIALKRITVQARPTVFKDRETLCLSMVIPRGPRTFWRRMLRHSLLEGWKAADHVFVTVPSLGRKHILQAHPFTIASPAPGSEDDEMHMSLLIRAMDGFSLDLLTKAKHLEHCSQSKPHLEVRLDGPYGSAHPRTFLASADLAVLVAGGSGIAVVWPLVHHLLAISRSTDTEIIPTQMLKKQAIILIWITHKREHMEWVSKQDLKEVEDLGVKIILPHATEEVGRPDLADMIQTIVQSYEQKGGNENKKTRVLASGPDSMGRLVRNTCSGLVRNGRNIDVTIEKFGW